MHQVNRESAYFEGGTRRYLDTSIWPAFTKEVKGRPRYVVMDSIRVSPADSHNFETCSAPKA